MATVLHPGRLSPTRQVPADITRPEYVGRKHPKTGEPDVKTPEIIERMRVAGQPTAARAWAASWPATRIRSMISGVLTSGSPVLGCLRPTYSGRVMSAGTWRVGESRPG